MFGQRSVNKKVENGKEKKEKKGKSERKWLKKN